MGDEIILTTEECEEVVAELLKTEFQLINYSIKPISDSVHGYMGQHLRVKCEVNVKGENKTIHFFIKKKIGTTTSAAQAKIAESLDMFKIEGIVLKFLNHGNENATWLPKLLKFKEPNIIVLEDLAERKYELSKFEFGCFDVDHCKCILGALVQLHGFSLNYDRKNTTSAVEAIGIFDDAAANMENSEFGRAWVKAGIDATCYLINETPLPQKHSKQEIIQKFKDYMPKYLKGMLPNKSKYQTITHGDLWGNNLMFKYDQGSAIDCCLIDFQVMRCLPFTQDVLFSIYVNTKKEFRKDHMDELVAYYYEQLCQLLSSQYGLDPEEVITKECYYDLLEERRLSALIIANWYKSFLLMDRSVFTDIMQGEASTDLIFGDRTKLIKVQLAANEKYRTLIFEELQDLIDVLCK